MAGCGSDDGVLTYDEFKAQAYQEADTGNYILNGDELVDSEDAMHSLYDSYLQSVADAQDRAEGVTTIEQGLIVNRVNNQDDKWSASQAQNLTYCVDAKSFGSRYSAVVSAMDSATGAWEATARVNFIHDASQDNNCNARNSNVVFDVREVGTTQYLARAFFPSSSRRSREVLVSTSSFGNISPWTLTGVLRHELGHTIGFRHEHTRPESGTCFEDNSWRALTAYDSSSVMHYPQCNGTQKGDLVLTNLDKTGASSLYP
ncbi:MAG TPA: M57 family metalloprotease [Kofleriaceae bacterium]|nr:M57 family metalloprotease [Kofleriaceae bacterium]